MPLKILLKWLGGGTLILYALALFFLAMRPQTIEATASDTTTEKTVLPIEQPANALFSTLNALVFASAGVGIVLWGVKEYNEEAIALYEQDRPRVQSSYAPPPHPVYQSQPQAVPQPQPGYIPTPESHPGTEEEEELQIELPGLRTEMRSRPKQQIHPVSAPPDIDLDGDPRKLELWKRLHQPESAFVLKLLKARPLLIWGGQNSGKTNFASFLTLIRHLFLGMPCEISDPHAHLNKSKWPLIFPVHGWHCNYAAIDGRLAAYYKRVEDPSVGYVTIWDEMTQYAERCSPNYTDSFLKSILCDSRKANEFVILLSHNDTLETLGGGKGSVKKMQDEGLIALHLFSGYDELGDFKFVGQGILKGPEKDRRGTLIEQPVELQDWMRPEIIYEMFPELRGVHEHNQRFLGNGMIPMPKPQQPEPEEETDIDLEQARESLNKVWNLESEDPEI